jgi:hypothetical protein
MLLRSIGLRDQAGGLTIHLIECDYVRTVFIFTTRAPIAMCVGR